MGRARKGRSKARAPEEERDAEGTTEAAAEVAAMAEEDERGGGRFFACYLLCSQSPRHKGHTYIGFTVNPRRRIRQHNGEMRCGAWRTKRGRPWEMVLCIYGFPTNVAALQFEWAWQHPTESLAVRKAASSFKSLSGVANKIKLAYTMLLLPSWENLNLTVNFFSTKYAKYSAGCPRLPKQMRINVCEMDDLPCYIEGHVFNDDGNDEDDDDVYGSKENVGDCAVPDILVKGVEGEAVDMESESSGSPFNWRVSEDFSEQIESTDSYFLTEHPRSSSSMLDTSVDDLTKEDTDTVRKVSTLDRYNWKVYKSSSQLTESEPFSPVESLKPLDEYERISPSNTSMADALADEEVQDIHDISVNDQSKETNTLRKVSTLDRYNWKVRKSSRQMTGSKESAKPPDEDNRISPSHDSAAPNTPADKLGEDAHDMGRTDSIFHWRNNDNCEQLLERESSCPIDIVDQSSECRIISPGRVFKSNCGDRLNQLLSRRGNRKASAKCVILSAGCNVIDLSTPPSCKIHSGTEKASVCSEIIDLTDSPTSAGEY